MKFLTRSAKETTMLACRLAKDFKGGEVVALNGGLGAGKTAFAKGVALGLDIKEAVNSPTFTILNIYEGRLKLCHYDAYRIENYLEASDMGLDEFFAKKDCVCIIEWADNIKELLTNLLVISVNITIKSKNTREISIDYK